MNPTKEEQMELQQEQWVENGLCFMCGSPNIAHDDFGSPEEFRCTDCFNGDKDE